MTAITAFLAPFGIVLVTFLVVRMWNNYQAAKFFARLDEKHAP